MTDITLPRDVVEKALEALLSVKNHGWNEDTHTGRALIATLRSRLAQPEPEPVFDYPRCGHCCPQRKPLTDGELADLWYKKSLDWLEFGRAIEAAHGIKENT